MSIDTTDPKPVNGPDRLPGDPSKEEYVERLIRVDHAGEYGAVRILSLIHISEPTRPY